MAAPRLHLLRPLALALVVVTVAFLAALWVSHGQETESLRHTHAIVLGAVGVVAGIASGAIAFRVLRRQALLVAAHSELLARRAVELEAFAGRVAHDLRNPLGALVLRVEGYRMDGHADAAALDKMAKIAGRMDRLIEGLLAFATSGAEPLPGARASLRAVVEEVLVDAHVHAERAAAVLTVEAIPAIEVACAPGTLASVLSNLLGNAAKYVAEGSGPRTICVRAFERNAHVRVEVADTGPGLPPGTEQRVFEPFIRVGNSHAPGLGIGLATVKRIIEAYQGRVGVNSTPGRGCTFWFELPAAPRTAAA